MPAFAQTDLATWRTRAAQGDAEALNALGNAHALGQGVPRDDNEALRYYQEAAKSGYAPACFNLGLIYELGRGVPRNEAEAARWYRQAAAQNHPRAALQLAVLLEDGRGVTRNEPEAARLYRIAAEQGIGAAQTSLGLMLAAGRGGLDINLPEALAWLTLAVDQGAPPASRDLILARLTPEQKAQSDRLLVDLRGRLSASAPVVPVTSLPATPSPVAEPTAVAAAAAVAASAATSPAAVAPRDDTSVADLRASLVQLRTENRELSAALTEAGRETRRLEQEVASLRAVPAQGASAPAEAPGPSPDAAALATLQAAHATLQTDLVAARKTIDEQLKLIAELTDAVEAAKASAAAVATSPETPVPSVSPATSNAELELARADAAALRAHVETLTADLANRTRERDEALARTPPAPSPGPGVPDDSVWVARLAAANQIAAGFQAQVTELSAANVALQEELAQLRADVARLSGAVRVLRGDNARLAAQVGVNPVPGNVPVLRLPPAPVVGFNPGRAAPSRPGQAPAAVPAPAATLSLAGEEARFHTVAPGDSLSALSLRYYGNARRWTEIFEANRGVLRTPNRLSVGQRLRIP